jgi:hypothetical protein
MSHTSIHVLINRKNYELDNPVQTGASLKKLAGILLEDTLFLERPGGDDEVIANDAEVTLRNGAHLHSAPPANYGSGQETVSIHINRKPYRVEPLQTGTSLKKMAGIPLEDTLFLEHPGGDDEVIANDAKVTLRGAHLHSAPPANYGDGGMQQEFIQPDGWKFLVYPEIKLPEVYRPTTVRLLVKLPPLFPEARPDMFWVSPAVTVGGTAPKGTTQEVLLGESWQRFSWHLADGAWRAGVSTLEDFLRSSRARFARRD